MEAAQEESKDVPKIDLLENVGPGEDDSVVSPADETEKVSLRTWLAIIAITVTYMASLGNYIMAANLTSVINASIGPSPIYIWMPSAWTVSSGVLLCVEGAITDLVGRRWVIVTTGMLGALACIVIGTAEQVTTAIAGMVLLGMNEAGAVQAFPAIAELVPTKHRGYYLALLNIAALPWVVFGTAIAFALNQDTGPKWRSVYWMFLAIHAVGSFVCFLFYKPAKPLAKVSTKTLIRTFDYVGLIGLTVGMTLFLMGIIWVPVYGARDAHFLAPFLIGSVVTIFTCFHQAYIAKHPLLHPELFRRVRTFTVLLVVVFTGGMLFFSLEAFFPQFLGLVYDSDPITIGLDSIPLGFGSIFGGISSAILLPKIGPKVGTRNLVIIGVIFQLIFIGCMAVPSRLQKPMALAFSCLGSVGIGWEQLLSVLLVQLACPDEWIGFATGLEGLARTAGGAVGTTIYTTIFQTKAAEIIAARVPLVAIEAGLPQTSVELFLGILTGAVPGDITSVPGFSLTILQTTSDALKDSYVSAFRYVWLSSLAFGGCALIAACCTKDLSDKLLPSTAQHIRGTQPEDKQHDSEKQVAISNHTEADKMVEKPATSSI